MKRNIPQLLLTCLAFYFLIDPLREIIMKGFSSSIFDGSPMTIYLLFTSLISFAFYSFCAYIGFFYFFHKRQWYFIVLTMFIGFFLSVGFRYFSQQVLSDWLFGFVNYRKDVSIGFYLRDQFYYAIMYVTVGIVYFNVQYGLHKDKREKELLLTNQKMELSLLRAQINPHFLLNSMNNIYSLVSMNAEKALPAIDTLSSILKYTLYENREMVGLQEELEYLQNYISLQSLRYVYEPAIELKFSTDTLSCKVPQFILVPLIENAFKHGDLKENDSPLVVESRKENAILHLFISNAIGHHEKDELGGIGLDNVKKRLQLLYGEEHRFHKIDDGKTFSITIEIPVR